MTITPIDNGVGAETFSNWLATLSPVWIPILTDGEVTCEAYEATQRVGIAITDNLVRMWGSGDDTSLFEKSNDVFSAISVVETNQVALLSIELNPGSTIAANNSGAVLVAPTF